MVRRFSAASVRMAKRNFLAVFNYHQVSPKFDRKYHLPQTWTDLAYFEKQIIELKSRFEFMRLCDAVEKMKSGTLRGPCAALTFDDGDISLERHVTPILAKHRVPATFFINTGYWGERRTYWVFLVGYLAFNEVESKRALLSEELKGQFRLLRHTNDAVLYNKIRERIETLSHAVDPGERFFVSKEFLSTLDPELFSVGLHGHEHQRLSMMPETWQRRNIEKNIRHLEDLPGYYPMFGIPFGRPHDWNDAVIRICEEMHLDIAFADGGINLAGGRYCERIPADGRNVYDEFRRNLVGW
jgi:peptidoglycan/xylan/chitin deacetylase (PgdA/CDA1 family)